MHCFFVFKQFKGWTIYENLPKNLHTTTSQVQKKFSKFIGCASGKHWVWLTVMGIPSVCVVTMGMTDCVGGVLKPGGTIFWFHGSIARRFWMGLHCLCVWCCIVGAVLHMF